MRSLGWVLTQYDWYPYRKGTSEHRHTNRRTLCEDRHRDRDDGSTRQRMPDTAANHQKLGERLGADSPSYPSEGTDPANTLILDL